MASRIRWRSSEWVYPVPGALGQGHRRPTDRRRLRGIRLGGRGQRRRGRLLAGDGLQRHERPTLSQPLKLEGKPVTRVENFCATGSEALRQASYAVASGAYDVAMAIGVEKIKDSGYQGLNAAPAPTTAPSGT